MSTQHVRNILKVYRAATDKQFTEGIEWYPNAFDIANDIANGDIWKGAGLLAAYSPLTPWWRNVILASESARTGIARTDTLPNNWKPAVRILDGEDSRDVVTGRKTATFCENIALAGKSDNVTVDSHALSIASGFVITAKKAKMSKSLYDEIEAAYRRAAVIANISETEIQAITWTVWRDRYPNKAARKGEL